MIRADKRAKRKIALSLSLDTANELESRALSESRTAGKKVYASHLAEQFISDGLANRNTKAASAKANESN